LAATTNVDEHGGLKSNEQLEAEQEDEPAEKDPNLDDEGGLKPNTPEPEPEPETGIDHDDSTAAGDAHGG
jgi:hypothetical protein